MRENEFAALEGFYILHETIGRGGFAKVKKATHTSGVRVAIKILDKATLGVSMQLSTRWDQLTINHLLARNQLFPAWQFTH